MIQQLSIWSIFFTLCSVVVLIVHFIWPEEGLAAYSAGLAAMAGVLWIITGLALMSEEQ